MGKATKEARKAAFKRWKEKYPEKWAAAKKRSYDKNVEARRAQKREYYQENKTAFRLRERKREQLLATVNELTHDRWLEIAAFYGNKCLACGASEVTLDHITPIVEGGRHHEDNVQPLCHSCNSSKGRKTIDYRNV